MRKTLPNYKLYNRGEATIANMKDFSDNSNILLLSNSMKCMFLPQSISIILRKRLQLEKQSKNNP